jgi:hypothetical protein
MMNYRYNRREFLSHSGAGIAGLVSGQWLGGATTAHAQGADVTPRDPDLVVFNAKVDKAEGYSPAFCDAGEKSVAKIMASI